MAIIDKAERSCTFIDSLVMGAALAAFLQHHGDDANNKIYKRGQLLWQQRYLPTFKDDLVLFIISPYVDEGRAPQLMVSVRQLSRLNQAKRILAVLPDFIKSFSDWLPNNRNTFTEGLDSRTRVEIFELAKAGALADPISQLAHLSGIRLTGQNKGIAEKWIDVAASDVGVVSTGEESPLKQMDTIRSLGEDISNLSQQIAVEPDGTPREAELIGKREDLLHQLQGEVEETTATSVAFAAASVGQDKVTDIVKKYTLTDEQEAIIRAEGDITVAAGAGSGKTTTLIAWMDHLVHNKGINPERMALISFTRAASSEIATRAQEQAGVRGEFIGRTTHAIARTVLRSFGPSHLALNQQYQGKLREAIFKTDEADKLWDIALKQVEMGNAAEGPDAEKINFLKDVLDKLIRFSPRPDFYISLRDQLDRGMLSANQLRALAEDKFKTLQKLSPVLHQGVRDIYEGRTPQNVKLAARMKAKSPYSSTPVGMRFNIGAVGLNDPKTGSEMVPGQVRLIVDNYMSAGVSVDEAYKLAAEDPDLPKIPAAAYDAYTWLKLNDPVLGPAMDYTDQLVLALKVLDDLPRARQAAQNMFDVVVVDEAQDLSDVQFRFFRHMMGRTRIGAFIGDDKQSIYKFRGAAPDNFIKQSENSQLFQMTTNFRSGEAIVNAANQLISHNKGQIPMTCRADPKKGSGDIGYVRAETHTDCAESVAQTIHESISTGDASASDFGILVRNNAELDAYEKELISRGVPFRKLRPGAMFFDKPLVRAVISWVRLAIGVGSREEINEAVANASTFPSFGLGSTFVSALADMTPANMSYVDFLLSGKPVFTDSRSAWKNKKSVEPFVNELRAIQSVGGDTESLILAVLNISGTKGSFKKSLMEKVNVDDVVAAGGGPSDIEAEALSPLTPILNIARSATNPQAFIDFIMKMKSANSKLQKDDEPKTPAVLMGTVHSWKGLQAPHVFVSMADGIFPNKFRIKTKEDMEEERRLAYVAITRGQSKVTVMSPQLSYLGESNPPRNPPGQSPFVEEACLRSVGSARAASFSRRASRRRKEEMWEDSSPRRTLLGQFWS